jgi:hypothetical protein
MAKHPLARPTDRVPKLLILILHEVSATHRDAAVTFEGFANSKGRLARLVFRTLQAASFSDAELKANHAVQEFLSQVSVCFNVPLIIATTHMVETSTSNQRIEIVTPFLPRSFASDASARPIDGFQVYASLYREALNSNSPVYRFLCFYKIIEGLRIRRNRLAITRQQNGESASRAREVLPADTNAAHAWLKELLGLSAQAERLTLEYVFPKGTLGKKYNNIIDLNLRPLRVGIAHAVLESGETTLVAHDLLHMKQVMMWLPLTNCIARQMLKTDFPSAFTDIVLNG